jgi:ribulose-5-phosphate 4-epimerase/fuculose-1-phosphate aldolase
VNHAGDVVEGKYAVNPAALAIHTHVQRARPDINAVAHAHSLHGKTWSTLGRLLDPITLDACAFYADHALYDDFRGVVLDADEGRDIGRALGSGKAVILRNHGLLTVGASVDSAVWWFIAMERACEVALRAESAGTPVPIPPEQAALTRKQTGSELAGWLDFQPLYQRIVREQPDLLE